ncbi:hypothetical protein PFICI_14178 [Pestalotiopsis fici W106-1]|uniref:Secreted protein n=1 Tax=Pestalotiopsis fici (strain W106-1 / CGMCC3.15140) TaxID=1229662 RepID=W3WME4_PESFW|nr:uncharacterized protein PFICI_14178 [Pestalotiopsis fici W106-1]ETS74312.1 hypothetical protein PFICI_14178 [Pestalotiopsis fici W106-1]
MNFLFNFLLLSIMAFLAAAAPLRPQSPPDSHSALTRGEDASFTTAAVAAVIDAAKSTTSTTWNDNDDGEVSQGDEDEDTWEAEEAHVNNDSDPWDHDTFIAEPST